MSKKPAVIRFSKFVIIDKGIINHSGKICIMHKSGEAMDCNKKDFEKVIKKFYKEKF